MRITESKLRRIIRSVIMENLDEPIEIVIRKEAVVFNKAYGEIMLATGSDHYDIDKDYVNRTNHYRNIWNLLNDEYYGREDCLKALELIGCSPRSNYDWDDHQYLNWFEQNTKNVIECLKKADLKTRKVFFSMIDAALA